MGSKPPSTALQKEESVMDHDNTNRGVLFNEKEVKSDKHPVMTGKLNVEGKEYRIAAWEKTSKTGSPFLSLAISEPKPAQRVAQVSDDEFDVSQIPF